MKLLLVNNFYAPNVFGGAERVTQLLAEELVALGHEVVVVTLAAGGRAFTDEVGGVRVHYVDVGNLGASAWDRKRSMLKRVLWHLSAEFNPAIAARMRTILRAERPDVVHTHNLAGFSVNVWRVAKQLGLPVVHTLHAHFLLCARGTMFRNDRNCTAQCADCRAFTVRRRSQSRPVDAVVGVSKYVLDRHLDAGYFGATHRRHVIYNACAVESERINGRKTEPQRTVRIGYLGRLHPTKGVDRLISEFGRLPDTGSHLAIGGNGHADYENELRRRGAKSNITFAGWVDSDRFLGEIDLLVVPSLWHEPLATTILEAYGHGLPVLVSRRGGMPEIVDEGVTGWSFEPDRPGELAGILKTLVAAPDSIRRARLHCKEKSKLFTRRRFANDYIDVYRRVLAA